MKRFAIVFLLMLVTMAFVGGCSNEEKGIEINQDLYLKSGDIHPVPEKLEDVKHRIRAAFERIGRIQ